MPRPPVCFVVMPFRAELNYFYLYIQKYLADKHGLRVERGDHRILTRALMDKIRDQIIEADVLLGDVTAGNPNVFYEIGLAHALGKPVIFLTQDDPTSVPIDIRQFEFIQYDLQRHDEFLGKLDNAIQNIFIGQYRDLYATALELLRQFNVSTGSTYVAANLEDFQARVMRVEQAQGIPPHADAQSRAEFLLPKVLSETSDVSIMRKVMDWISSYSSAKPITPDSAGQTTSE